MNKISPNFLNELFLLCFYKKVVIDTVYQYLDYEHIPDELREYKKILKSIKSYYVTSGKELPSFGLVSQQHINDLKVQEKLAQIKETKFVDVEQTLVTFEEYIKLSKFELLNRKIVELYNAGNSQQAIEVSAKESAEIFNFTIKKQTNYFSRVFGDFEHTLIEKQYKKDNPQHENSKVPFGILSLDIETDGGIDVTDTALWILRSGVGKSTALRWTGMNACRLGFNVLHVQAEGSREECYDKYTQLWTACLYNDVKHGNINDDLLKKLRTDAAKFLSRDKDLYIHAYEQFNSASMTDVRQLAQDFIKIKGGVDLIIIDYLSKIHPGDGLKYGVDTQSVKMRKENTADKMKNLAVELNTRILTADQAVGVPKDLWNDPSKVLDRYNIAGAKNLVDSFSYVFTGNQTEQENLDQVIRIYIDKLRNYAIKNRVLSIATNYDRGRFFEIQRTTDLFGNG